MKRVLPLLALLLVVHSAGAQRGARRGGSVGDRPGRLEILAGMNLATASADGVTDSRTGLVAGLGIVKPLAPGWAFEPEITYSMKGAKTTDLGTRVTLKLDYIEIPLLFRYEFPGQSNVQPFINFGPAPAFKVNCSNEATGPSGVTVSQSCENDGFEAKSFDLGLIGGAGLAFRQMRHTVTVGVRYDYGLIDIVDSGDGKNRVWSFVATIDFPWGSR